MYFEPSNFYHADPIVARPVSPAVLCAVGTILLCFGWHRWPCCCFCLTPLVLLGRSVGCRGRKMLPTPSRTVFTFMVTGIGFLVAWMRSGFISTAVQSFGWAWQAVAAIVFSMHFAIIGLAIVLSAHRSVLSAALICTIVAVCSERLQAHIGFTWALTSLCYAAIDTPIAQCSNVLTPFGVSGIIYCFNFLFAGDRSGEVGYAMRPQVLAIIVLAAGWGSGVWIRATTTVPPVPFTAALVQPHLVWDETGSWTPWQTLLQLTEFSLERNGPVDLVVWPESALSDSLAGSVPFEPEVTDRLSLQQFAREHQRRLGTNCLVGVGILQRGVRHQYGFDIPTMRRFNCGCLVTGPESVQCHKKLLLVPFREADPEWLDWPWIRAWVPARFRVSRPFARGNSFQPLRFIDANNQARTISVSVCYEAFFHWLPQYNTVIPVDAVVHILYDGDSVPSPSVRECQIAACRFRAIETRTWNLVCSTWAGTAIIDPTGRVVRRLPAAAGVLRTDAF